MSPHALRRSQSDNVLNLADINAVFRCRPRGRHLLIGCETYRLQGVHNPIMYRRFKWAQRSVPNSCILFASFKEFQRALQRGLHLHLAKFLDGEVQLF
jgi:hypothetical protein